MVFIEAPIYNSDIEGEVIHSYCTNEQIDQKLQLKNKSISKQNVSFIYHEAREIEL